MTDANSPTLADVAAALLAAQEAGLHPTLAMDRVRDAYRMLSEYEHPRQRAMLEAVQADLAGLDVSAIPGGQTYRALALRLASVIDKRGDDDGPSTTAKLTAELTKAMAALTRKGGGESGDGFESWQDDASTPVKG